MPNRLGAWLCVIATDVRSMHRAEEAIIKKRLRCDRHVIQQMAETGVGSTGLNFDVRGNANTPSKNENDLQHNQNDGEVGLLQGRGTVLNHGSCPDRSFRYCTNKVSKNMEKTRKTAVLGVREYHTIGMRILTNQIAAFLPCSWGTVTFGQTKKKNQNSCVNSNLPLS